MRIVKVKIIYVIRKRCPKISNPGSAFSSFSQVLISVGHQLVFKRQMNYNLGITKGNGGFYGYKCNSLRDHSSGKREYFSGCAKAVSVPAGSDKADQQAGKPDRDQDL